MGAPGGTFIPFALTNGTPFSILKWEAYTCKHDMNFISKHDQVTTSQHSYEFETKCNEMNADSNADLTFIGGTGHFEIKGWKQTDGIPMKLTQFKQHE